MFFHTTGKNRKKSPKISVYQNENLLYEGYWQEIPLYEHVIIENSIPFDDSLCLSVQIELLNAPAWNT